MTNIEKDPATFVATTRTDLKDLASIALYLESRGEFGVTRSGILNIGIKMLGVIVQKQFPVNTYSKALNILTRLGYKDPREKGTKYYHALAKAIEGELLGDNHKLSLMEEIAFHRESAERLAAGNKIDIEKAKVYIAELPSIPSLAEIDQRSATEAKKLRRALEVPEVDVEDTGE